MLCLQQLAPTNPSVRNAPSTTKQATTIPRHPNAVTRWIRLKQLFMQQRGGVQATNNKFVPRTTNADVMQLATLWSRELAKVSPGDDHDRSEHRRWANCMEMVKRTADPSKPDAVFGKNEEFWQACTRRLSIYLMARKAVPSKWRMFKEAVAETIAGVPGVLGDATKTTAGLVTDVTGSAVKLVSKPARAALVVLGAAILLPPIVRAVRK